MSSQNIKLACLQSVKRQNGKRRPIVFKIVDLVALIDRSGSVGSLSPNGWAEGFVAMIKEQKLLLSKDKTLKIFVTLVTFDGFAVKYYQQIDANKIPTDLSEVEFGKMFQPRGGTLLIDTLYTAGVQQNVRIVELGKKYGEENVSGVMIIWTDGQDNMSSRCTEVMVHQLLTDIQRKPRRTVLFTAANQDAIKTGAKFGVRAANCLTTRAVPGGAIPMYRAASAATARACSGGGGAFTQQERAANTAPAVFLQAAPANVIGAAAPLGPNMNANRRAFYKNFNQTPGGRQSSAGNFYSSSASTTLRTSTPRFPAGTAAAAPAAAPAAPETSARRIFH